MSAPSISWDHYGAVLFDLDGVLTPTAELHQRAWSQMFDEFLDRRGDAERFSEDDYLRFVDGKQRLDGVRGFLDSRGIELAFDGPETSDGDTITSLGEAKNAMFNHLLRTEGIVAYPGSVALLDALAGRPLKLAVVSSSRNAPDVLAAAGLTDRFELVVDGNVAAERDLASKPAPDMFLAAADDLGVGITEAIVFEDAVAGVAAARAGEFGLIVGVDRGAGRDALTSAGADLVVDDLGPLVPAGTTNAVVRSDDRGRTGDRGRAGADDRGPADVDDRGRSEDRR